MAFASSKADTASIDNNLLKSLMSGHAPIRQAALHGVLLRLSAQDAQAEEAAEHHHMLRNQLADRLQQLLFSSRISAYEQALCWTALLMLIQAGSHHEVTLSAVSYLDNRHHHICSALVFKGVVDLLRSDCLPKELVRSVFHKMLMDKPNKQNPYKLHLLLVQLFMNDTRIKSNLDLSNMDPDILMSSMEKVTSLYKVVRGITNRMDRKLVSDALILFLKETLPPAASLRTVVVEFLNCCHEAEKVDRNNMYLDDRWQHCSLLTADIVFEVFETSMSQSQLPVLSGWLFEAMNQLLSTTVSKTLTPFCLLCLLLSSSPQRHIRNLAPLVFQILKVGLKACSYGSKEELSSNEVLKNIYREESDMAFADRRLMCLIALYSDFTKAQLQRLKELCQNNSKLGELAKCLDAT